MCNTENKNLILIIDDDASNIIALSNILSPEYRVFAAKNGLDAIKLADEHMPDVILLDILMHEMDGFEVISTLKSLKGTKNIPVIFISGLNDIEAEKKGLALGAADYISKPFNPDIVKLRVKIQIDLVNHIRTLEERDEMERQLNLIRKLEAGLISAKEDAEYQRKLAEHSSRAKSEFLSRMSHEMRTPMNIISGMLQVVSKKGVPDDIKKHIDDINKASAHLLEMINDVLDVSGMEHGIFKLDIEEFNTSAMFNELYKKAEHNASQKNQVLHFNTDPSIPQTLKGDENRLKQAISNLLKNAIKFSYDNDEIIFNIEVKNVDNKKITLLFEVIDNGIGISEDQQKALFTMFEQVDGSITRKHGGIGVGLSLSKRIIEMMDGDIWVESEPGKGTKFTFTCVLEV